MSIALFNLKFGLDAGLQIWVIGISLLVWLVLLFLAVRRTNRQWLVLRMLALSLACFSLMFVILQPLQQFRVTPGQLIIATEHASINTIDSLKEKFPGVEILSWPKQSIVPILKDKAVTQIHVVGDGLPASELEKLSGIRLQFYLNALPNGLTNIHFRPELKVGDPLEIGGRFYQNDTTSRTLKLIGPELETSLLERSEPTDTTFAFTTKTKQAGTFLYQLLEVRSNNSDTIGQLAVKVLPRQSVRILMLNDAPSFESKYMIDWLAEMGYPVAIRSRISRDQYISTFHHIAERQLRTISANLLQQFDLLILPVAAFSNLSPNEQQLISNAVTEGLGLLSISSATNRSLPPALRPLLPPIQPAPTQSLTSISVGQTLVELNTSPFRLSLFPVSEDSQGLTLSAYRLKGQGKVGFFLPTNTYHLVLDGHSEAYAKLWQPTLEALSRHQNLDERWEVDPSPVILPHAPLTIKHYSTSEPKSILAGEEGQAMAELFPMQHPLNEELFQYTYWPTVGGWHEVRLEEEGPVVFTFWVGNADTWATLRRTQLIVANQQKQQANFGENDEAEAPVYTTQAWPQWIFYLLFLVCVGFLWMEEKWYP